MLFPQLGPQYYDQADKDILNRMEDFYSQAITINQAFWGEADTDTRFYNGDQTIWNNIYGNVMMGNRRMFSFNRIRRIVNMISGHQRRNRKSTIVTPVENADQETADQFTKVLMWVAQQEGVLETISTAFEGALVTGMNLLQVWMDYRQDPLSGNIRINNCAYNAFLMDPYFRNPDLSDCNAIWKRSFLTKRECVSLMPQHTQDIMGLAGQDARDGKFQFIPESYNYGLKNLLTYDEFYYRDYRKQKLLIDTQTGESLEWKSQDDESLDLFLQTYPTVKIIESEIPTVRLAILIQGKVFYDDANPLGIDQYPFVPVFGYYSPQTPYFQDRIQGVVRGLRDSQYLYNRRKIVELDILESQINSGWKYKPGSLVNPQDVFLSGQGKGLAIKDDALLTDVEQIIAPSIPPSMIQLSELLGKEISEISGVNEELLGSALDDKAGILSMLRQGAGLTTLQNLFDQLDYSQKLLGKIMIGVIQANFMPGKVERILEKQPSPQFYNKAFGRYDAAVEEGFNTTTQRQMEFAQLIQLREIGVPIPDDVIIKAATLQNKNDLIEAITAQQQQQAEVAQAQLQVQMQEQQARTQLSQARAMADQGLGLERISRIEENKALAVERQAEAEKDDQQALLNFVKALKEIETIDLDHLEKLITLSQSLKQQSESPIKALQ